MSTKSAQATLAVMHNQLIFLNEGTLCCPAIMLISDKYAIGGSLLPAAGKAEDRLQHS